MSKQEEAGLGEITKRIDSLGIRESPKGSESEKKAPAEPSPPSDQSQDQKADSSGSNGSQPQPAEPSLAQAPPQPSAPPKKSMIILRGVPGSGKSTLGKSLLEKNPRGQIFSSDDFFMKNGRYIFDPSLLGDAHAWNQGRVFRAMAEGVSPVIVDNTHTQKWEARPYVREALRRGYQVTVEEPDTPWKRNAQELARKNVHKVPLEAIERMLQRWETDFTVEAIMESRRPQK